MGDVAQLEDWTGRLIDRERVAALKGHLPDVTVLEDVAAVFGLFSDPRRLALLTAMLEGGELCVCDLAAVAGMSESAASHALRLLRAQRVVRVRRDGRLAYYSLRDGHVRILLDVALEHQSHTDE